MNDLMLFEGQHEVMILTKNDLTFDFHGDFLILASNVSKALEYTRTEEVTKFCKEGQVFIVRNSDLSISALNRNRKLHNTGEAFITNLALNRVFGKSEKPKAEPFQDWLYEDVLPSIHKHGAYATPQTLDNMIDNPEFGIKVLTALQKERNENKALQIKSAEKDKVIEEMKPKAAYTDIVLKNKGLVTVTQIAKDYGMTAQEMNDLLYSLQVQYKQSKQWLLYKKYADKGYVHSNTIPITRSDGTPDISMSTKWTQKGRLFIYELLKADKILPVIERDLETKRGEIDG